MGGGEAEKTVSWYHVASVVTGFVIGAGILGLPIKFGCSGMGFVPGVILIVVGGIFQALTALFIVKVMLVRGSRELTGYTLELLGRGWWVVLFVSVFLYTFGALEAYLNYGGKALETLTHGLIGFRQGMILYWLVGLIIVYFGARALGNAEAVLVAGFFMLLAVIVALCVSSPSFTTDNLLWMNPSRIMAGFGVTIFAYAAHFAVPSIGRHYRGNPKPLAIAVTLGFLLPMIGYVTWTAGFMGLIEPSEYEKVAGLPAPIAVAMLGRTSKTIVALGYTFGFLTTFTSFIAALYSLSRITQEFVGDLTKRYPRETITLLAMAILVLLVGLTVPLTFIEWLDVAGGIGAPLFSGIIPSLMLLKLGRKAGEPPLRIKCWKPLAILSLVFYVFGMIYFVYTYLIH